MSQTPNNLVSRTIRLHGPGLFREQLDEAIERVRANYGKLLKRLADR